MAMKRFQIAEDSMRPALSPGDEILATDSITPGKGDVVVFPHPQREDFWMVKRVVDPPHEVEGLWVLSDNADATTADSRTLGPIDPRTAMTRVEHLDETSFAEGCDLLASEDEALGAALSAHGTPPFWSRQPGFATLALLILEQQVSLESAAAVYTRLLESAGSISPEQLLALGEENIRQSGVTRQKTGYLLDLADRIVAGSFDLDGLSSLPTARAQERLVELRGIGPWTADAYLLSALGRPDMWPVGDRALQVGTAEVLGMSEIPDQEELEILGVPWRPARSIAARIIWHAYLSVRGRTEPSHPDLHSGTADA